ncbi:MULTISPECIES: GntR family transcriptional regulator [unclassified Variovorax]|uniref:GntR family transcriptional regulator n=1 Tax=unclassified Variovorax TaxID=663243 RepID=UPI001BD5BB43|nr:MULTISPECIES: GntR family transcriptional regulator [unclassified Variovorax]
MRAASPTAIPSTRQDKEGNEEIYERIYVAILEHRLLPGSKLPEEKMAKVFNVSRSRIREVLSRLAYEKIVELIPNRGAYIASPTVAQARDVFEARRVIEPAIIHRLVQNKSELALEGLRKHLDLEALARKQNDTRSVIRLSGEFHNLCAKHAGNAAFTRSLRELTSLTCLIILLYDAALSDSCRADEHALIVEAIARGDGVQASQLMLHHLDHIESSLELTDRLNAEVDIDAIFGAPRVDAAA